MKHLAALLLAVATWPALAQPGPGWLMAQGGRFGGGEQMHHMPPPERRMSREERQRLREQVRNGNMTREEARAYWRAQRERRGRDAGRSPEERQKLRRDVMEANRAIERR